MIKKKQKKTPSVSDHHSGAETNIVLSELKAPNKMLLKHQTDVVD